MLEGKGAVAVKEKDLYTWKLSFGTLFIPGSHLSDQPLLSSLIVSEEELLTAGPPQAFMFSTPFERQKAPPTAEGGRAARLADCVGAQTDVLAETTEVLILLLVRALNVALGGDDAVIETELLPVLIVGSA